MKPYTLRSVCIALIVCACSGIVHAKAKTDVIFLKNGDRVTGEVKSLLRGKLELKTDHMGTILIDWVEIQEIMSDTSQVVELGNGTRFFGSLEQSPNPNTVEIDTDDGAVGVDSDDIVAMYPVEAGFWDRMDISAKLGFSWDKASNVGRGSLGIDVTYRDPEFITRGNFSTELTTQQDQPNSKRAVLTVNHMRFLQNKRFRALFGSMEQNDELGLDLRALLGAGYGWIPIRDQRTLFGLMLGVDVNYEIPTSGADETNVELVGGLSYDYFLYSHPERRLRVDFNVYPSLTQSGRYRANLNTSFKVEFFTDLYWDVSLYASYDNQPLAEDAATSDVGVTSSLGYKF